MGTEITGINNNMMKLVMFEDPYNNKSIPFFKPVYYNKQISNWIQDY